MSLLRVLVTTKVTMSHTFEVDGAPTDAAGAVTVTAKRLDGTTVASGSATHPETGRYTFPLPGQAQLDTLTVDWSGDVGGATVTVRDYVEIVGGFIFGLGEARIELGSEASKYSLETLAAKRIEVEQECERIRRQAQVPRFTRLLLDGSGTDELVVPDLELRALRAASVAERAGGTFVALTAGELAAVAPLRSGVLARDDGGKWPYGRRNVLVEYEYGLDMPGEGIRSAAKLRLRSRLTMNRSAIPDRALSFTTNEGGTYRLTTAGPRSTGQPDVDAEYLRDAHERVWIA